MLKPIAHCNLRKQIGHKCRGRRSASSKWFDPCIRHASHWQCRSPNMCPISWVKVCKTFTLKVYSATIINNQLCTPSFSYFPKKQIYRNQLPYNHHLNYLPKDLTPHFLKRVTAFLTIPSHLLTTAPGILSRDTNDTLGSLFEGRRPS